MQRERQGWCRPPLQVKSNPPWMNRGNHCGQDQVLWVDEGIVGDDTDGHIDDTVRFVNEDTVLTVVEENKADENSR